jgi:hypothetical protein
VTGPENDSSPTTAEAEIDTDAKRRPAPQARTRTRRLAIIAQDPSVRGEDGLILTAEVAVPVDRLEPGPRSHRFHVVDFDATTNALGPVPDLCDPAADEGERRWTCLDGFPAPASPADEAARYPKGYNAALLADPAFRAQNAYAIAARTLAAFEFALGRRVDWAFDTHQLYIVPRAFVEANAHYAREDRGVFFGYLPQHDGSTVYTCLSHDIVCHETAHAVLDGLRPRFLEPALPDQPAFHEALADIVALFSVFSLTEVVEFALGEQDKGGRISTDDVGRDALAKNVLFGVAEQFGEVTTGVRGSALRRSSTLPQGKAWRSDPAFDEPHRRAEVLVAAVIDTMVGMWLRRLEPLIHKGRLDRERTAEEGAKAASHLMMMIIRSLDYSPAVELEFEDVLDAVVTADEVIAPDDPHHYRDALCESFARYDIHQPKHRMVDLSAAAVRLRYDHVNASALRSSKQEAYRFIWQNLGALNLKPDWHLQVEALRPALRVGPDGLVVQEVICDYVQVLELTAGQARSLAEAIHDEHPKSRNQLELPASDALADDVSLQFWGGGTLIFDQFGRAKLHQRKPLNDWRRQSERLVYLLRKGLFDTRRRLGYSTGIALGMAFADLHAPDREAGEAW